MYNMPYEQWLAQLQDGLILLVLGMGFVFVFLTVLIFTTKLMSKVVNKVAPAEAAPAAKASPAASQRVSEDRANKDPEIAAAIAAAYAKSRN